MTQELRKMILRIDPSKYKSTSSYRIYKTVRLFTSDGVLNEYTIEEFTELRDRIKKEHEFENKLDNILDEVLKNESKQ